MNSPRLVGAQYATGNQWRNNSRKSEEMEPKQKQHPVVDVPGDGSKVRCCKEPYRTGTWDIRSMNQGKLEVVQQEMARVNVNILGISELNIPHAPVIPFLCMFNIIACTWEPGDMCKTCKNGHNCIVCNSSKLCVCVLSRFSCILLFSTL